MTNGTPREVREAVVARDGACLSCGSITDLTVHHIRPRAIGGQSKLHNLVLLCRSCHDEIEQPVQQLAKLFVGCFVWMRTLRYLRRGECQRVGANGRAVGRSP